MCMTKEYVAEKISRVANRVALFSGAITSILTMSLYTELDDFELVLASTTFTMAAVFWTLSLVVAFKYSFRRLS